MQLPFYEGHVFQNAALPFFFHRDMLAWHNCCNLHWHANIELLLAREGAGTLICEGVPHSFAEGDLFIVNSNRLHTINAEKRLVYDCLIVDLQFCEQNGIPTDGLFFQEKIGDADVTAAYNAISAAYQNETDFRTTAIRHAVLGLMLLLCRRFLVTPSADNMPGGSSARIREAILYIRKNLDKPLSLEHISKQIGISKFYFSREFKRHTGQTLTAHIQAVRCAEAKRLIESGMRASDAAFACGFENLSYFTKIYKRTIGALPSKEKHT